MWRRRRSESRAAAPVVPVAPVGPMWMGEIVFDVPSSTNSTIGPMIVQLSERHLGFRWCGRDLGRLDREHVRAWLQQPDGDLTTEWLLFFRRRERIHLAMGAHATKGFPLPPDLVAALLSRV